MPSSRIEIRDSILNTTRQDKTQIGTLVEEFINITLREINDPGWAFNNKYNHLYSWLRRKTTFSTVASQSDYVLPREVDRIAILRQTTSPARLKELSDDLIYRIDPDPTDTGNPLWYRRWETEGVATRLAAADTIDVVSSSASDAGSAELAISISGYVEGIWRTETYQLNGTTTVNGSLTFQAREIYISKQKNTTGTITITENSGGTTLLTLGPKERSARFKVITLYPIPSSAITMYLEYYGRIPDLNNDSDVPIFDEKWHYVVRLGALTKVYEYLRNEVMFAAMQGLYKEGVKSMVSADKAEPDIIEYLLPEKQIFPTALIRADATFTT